MNKTLLIAISVLLMAALALPASAGKAAGTSKVYKVTNKIYYQGKSYAVDTEEHMTGMFRNAFALFNPCLDMIKGCSAVVMYPIEKPLDMIEKATSKRKVVQKASPKIPQPKKPEMPK